MNIPTGKNVPEEINVYIEIPAGSDIKYEVDKKSGALFVDRFLYTAFRYPFNYGFVPNTLADDGDPVDVLVLSEKSVAPGVVIPCIPIGMLAMEDEEGIDTKVIAVPTQKVDPFYGAWKDIDDVPKAITDKIKHFFEHYKELEPGKWVKVKEWKDKKAALVEIQKGIRNIV